MSKKSAVIILLFLAGQLFGFAIVQGFLDIGVIAVIIVLAAAYLYFYIKGD